MGQTDRPAALAAMARQTAQALCWWQNPSDPADVYTEATSRQENIPLGLSAIWPQTSLP
jgi:hypothetical protein